jgi:hypothetical protein
VDDLKQGARASVTNGIIGLQSKQDAEDVIRRLRTSQVLPECGSPTTSGSTPTGTTTTRTVPTTTTPPHTSATAPPIGGGAGVTPTTVPTAGPTVSPTTSRALVPGVDCRKAGN